MFGQNLNGLVPSELGLLAELERLDLSFNLDLSGVMHSGLCTEVLFNCTERLCGCDCECILL